MRYFGKWSDDPKGLAANQLWLDQKDDLKVGRVPRCQQVGSTGVTIRELCNRFCTAKERQRDAGDITNRTFDDYHATCEVVLREFGKDRLVSDLAVEDFEALRATLAKRGGSPNTLSNEVQRIRTLFKYGYDSGVTGAVKFGPTFKRPKAKQLREHRQKKGLLMFEAAQLRTIMDHAPLPLRAMILLGVNVGFGNHDCGTLPLSALDLKAGIVAYPRPKTAVLRRAFLWPETVDAIQESLAIRPASNDMAYDQLVFVTRFGEPWAKDTCDNPITKEFRKLLDELKLHRDGLGFYALRHTFETIGGDCADQVAVNHIMGHVDSSMAATYRETVFDARLKRASE